MTLHYDPMLAKLIVWAPSRELAIVELRVPGIAKDLADALVRFVEAVRKLDLKKRPSISERKRSRLATGSAGSRIRSSRSASSFLSATS